MDAIAVMVALVCLCNGVCFYFIWDILGSYNDEELF